MSTLPSNRASLLTGPTVTLLIGPTSQPFTLPRSILQNLSPTFRQIFSSLSTTTHHFNTFSVQAFELFAIWINTGSFLPEGLNVETVGMGYLLETYIMLYELQVVKEVRNQLVDLIVGVLQAMCVRATKAPERLVLGKDIEEGMEGLRVEEQQADEEGEEGEKKGEQGEEEGNASSAAAAASTASDATSAENTGIRIDIFDAPSQSSTDPPTTAPSSPPLDEGEPVKQWPLTPSEIQTLYTRLPTGHPLRTLFARATAIISVLSPPPDQLTAAQIRSDAKNLTECYIADFEFALDLGGAIGIWGGMNDREKESGLGERCVYHEHDGVKQGKSGKGKGEVVRCEEYDEVKAGIWEGRRGVDDDGDEEEERDYPDVHIGFDTYDEDIHGAREGERHVAEEAGNLGWGPGGIYFEMEQRRLREREEGKAGPFGLSGAQRRFLERARLEAIEDAKNLAEKQIREWHKVDSPINTGPGFGKDRGRGRGRGGGGGGRRGDGKHDGRGRGEFHGTQGFGGQGRGNGGGFGQGGQGRGGGRGYGGQGSGRGGLEQGGLGFGEDRGRGRGQDRGGRGEGGRGGGRWRGGSGRGRGGGNDSQGEPSPFHEPRGGRGNWRGRGGRAQ
ncbi:MAG: hypothetical protein M1836_007456 [Candelina mexicana]|nr:MAG: hypothetical protein M1836_007456 [Candelina mexicana]